MLSHKVFVLKYEADTEIFVMKFKGLGISVSQQYMVGWVFAVVATVIIIVLA